MNLRRKRKQRPLVTVTERTGGSAGRVTNMGPGDTMMLSHRITINDPNLHIDREFVVAEIRVER